MKPQIESRSPYQIQCLADSMKARLESYSPTELASRVGISRRSVLAAIRSGNLKAKRLNARVFRIESYDAAAWWVSTDT